VLSFQRLDVYRCSIEFLAVSAQLPARLPRGHASLAEQLRRAALSVPLNIAEAAGRTTEADAARHYAIARGSAMECAAIVDGLHVLAVVDAQLHARAVELLGRIVAMLTKLCR
jgi:four helix bundle protein